MHVTFYTQKYNFDKATAILTLTFQALVSGIDCLWWRVMGGDGERGKAWLRARGHHLCLTDTIFFFFFFFFFFLGGGGGVEQGNWPFTLREHWKITHYF